MAKKSAVISTKPRVELPESKIYSLSWEAAEFHVPHRPIHWYIGLVLVFAGFELLAIVSKDIFNMIIPVAALVGVLAYPHFLKPRTLEYSIDDRGFHIGQKSYSPAEITSYWFAYTPDPVLNIEIKGRLLPMLVSLNPDIDEELVRHAMPPGVKEDLHREEDMMAKLIRMLRL